MKCANGEEGRRRYSEIVQSWNDPSTYSDLANKNEIEADGLVLRLTHGQVTIRRNPINGQTVMDWRRRLAYNHSRLALGRWSKREASFSWHQLCSGLCRRLNPKEEKGFYFRRVNNTNYLIILITKSGAGTGERENTKYELPRDVKFFIFYFILPNHWWFLVRSQSCKGWEDDAIVRVPKRRASRPDPGYQDHRPRVMDYKVLKFLDDYICMYDSGLLGFMQAIRGIVSFPGPSSWWSSDRVLQVHGTCSSLDLRPRCAPAT